MIFKKNIALLYFSRTVESEVDHKIILDRSSKKEKLSLANWMVSKTQHVLDSVDLDTFYCTEENQIGLTFAERLTQAHIDIYSKGYDAIITVGNDCVELSSVDWDHVIDHLLNGDCVLGPDMRGGAYLIGITKHHFCEKAFANLEWQTDKLYNDLYDLCLKDNGSIEEMPNLSDINTYEDLKRLIANVHLDQETRSILEKYIFVQRSEYIYSDVFKVSHLYSGNYSLRGPPF